MDFDQACEQDNPDTAVDEEADSGAESDSDAGADANTSLVNSSAEFPRD
ncbi:MAG: hypothetical protein GY847_39525 [Proteobacteria bacterium]|nr:hypothetical protein [Pseudomonadota bacterium]